MSKRDGVLSGVTTDALLGEVLRRHAADPTTSGLFNERGFLSNGAFGLADILGIRVCVDGAAVRRAKVGTVELMAIRRATGPYVGKLCLVGGGVSRIEEDGVLVPESFEEALKRHFKTDLGWDVEPVTSWNEPQYLAQDMRPDADGRVRDGFTPNGNSRHLVAARYLVTTNDDTPPTFGSTEHGGQEACEVVWFSRDHMPDPSHFGYGHDQTYATMFRAAEKLLPA